jgi:hypothetical protein
MESLSIPQDAIPLAAHTYALVGFARAGIDRELDVLNAGIKKGLCSPLVQKCAVRRHASPCSGTADLGNKFVKMRVDTGLTKAREHHCIKIGKQRHQALKSFAGHEAFLVSFDQARAHLALEITEKGGLDMKVM